MWRRDFSAKAGKIGDRSRPSASATAETARAPDRLGQLLGGNEERLLHPLDDQLRDALPHADRERLLAGVVERDPHLSPVAGVDQTRVS